MTYHTGTRHYDMVTLVDAERKVPRHGYAPKMAVLPPVNEPKDEWSDAEIGRMVRLTKGGWDPELIGETMDIPTREVAQKQGVIARAMNKRVFTGDVPPEKVNRSKLTDEQKEELERAYDAGWTLRALAKRSGLSYEGVRWVLGKRGAL